jgi:hypothetical protein
MSRWIGVIVALLIGIAIGIAIERSREAGKPRAHIMLRVDEASKRVLLNPQYDDVLEWRKATPGGGLEPTKPIWVWGHSPCDSSGDTCRINKRKGWWAYHCEGDSCIDPEVPIGDEIVIKNALSAGLPTPAPVPENIGCDEKNNAAIDPASPVKVSKSQQGAVNWTALDEAANQKWNLGNWRDMNNMSQQVCANPVDQDQNLCTLTASAMPGMTYRFDATVNACSGTKTATFELTVLQ